MKAYEGLKVQLHSVLISALEGASGHLHNPREKPPVPTAGWVQESVFFLSFSLLTGWQLSIWNCYKPFKSQYGSLFPQILSHDFLGIQTITQSLQ